MGSKAQAAVNDVLGASPAATAARVEVSLATEAGSAETGRAEQRPFSVFIAGDMQAAAEFADALSAEAAELRGTMPDDAIVERLAARVAAENSQPERGIAEHGFKLFITHNPAAAGVRVPNLMARMAPLTADLTESAVEMGGTADPDEENLLNWFREDPLANEHHEHWHVVYPTQPTADRPMPDRHGELFYYMHNQMLARYDAERIAAGLQRVKAFDDYAAALPVGYDPGGMAIAGQAFAPRARGQTWIPFPTQNGAYTPADHRALKDKFDTAVSTLTLTGGATPLPLAGAEGSDALGDASEPNGKGQERHGGNYGNHHGMGHMLTAILGRSAALPFGVMADPATAIRDPFFWQWHKHVDDFNARYQETQPVHDFADAPDVVFGGGDDEGIVLIDEAALAEAVPDGVAQDVFLEFALGRDRFAQPAASGSVGFRVNLGNGPVDLALPVIDTLATEMRHGSFELFEAGQTGKQFSYPYLWHRPFRFALRLINQAAETQTATVRLFLCPASDEAMIDDRRLWIELDKFAVRLEPGTPTVVTRRDKSSSVIRRPVFEPHHVTDIHYLPEAADPEFNPYCECGWPYHLLIPRGTEAGMRFALLAVVTGDDNLVPQGHCGSVSFCGARDQYPDVKPMGYPFDRPLASPMKQLVAEKPTMAMRFITIRTAAE